MADMYVKSAVSSDCNPDTRIRAIASAVAMPDDVAQDESPRPHGLKRRKSDIVEEKQESKRQRVSPGKNSPTAARDDANTTPSSKAGQPDQKPTDIREARRKSSIADEKQRSKRLFGALLGSLNQPSDRTSKRRQEIESRRKAELQRQDDERLENKLRRQERLAEQRKKVQVKVDEENVGHLYYHVSIQYRFDNPLAAAHTA